MVKKYQRLVIRLGKRIKKLDKRYIIGISLLLFIGIFFLQEVVSVFTALVLFIIGCLSTIYRRFIPLRIGFELVTFATVLYCFAYNPTIAWILGIIMTFISTFIIGGSSTGISVFIKIITYAIMGVTFYVVQPMGIVAGGIAMIVLYNILTRISILFFGANPVLCVFAFFLNIGINSYLLMTFGVKLLSLMT